MRIFALFALFVSLLLPQSGHAIETTAKAAIVVDATTGTVLFDKNADEPMPPSSMSKLMTAYVVFQHLKDGRLKLTDELPVSEKAWAMQGSKMFVAIDSKVKVEDLLRGMIIQSGNDACIVLAEAIGGSEDEFAMMMNHSAKSIGLLDSNFVNSSGWPANGQYVTAKDLATLAKRLVDDFPEYMHYYKETDFTYNKIKQGNRNPLLYGYSGADGFKTGHTDEAGYGLVGTAVRDGRRLITVFNGVNSMQERADEARKLLDFGFREFRNIRIMEKSKVYASPKVWQGVRATVDAIGGQDLVLTVPAAQQSAVAVTLSYAEPAYAPVSAGQQIGEMKVQVGGPSGNINAYPLLAKESVDRVGFFARVQNGLSYLLTGNMD